MKKQSLTISVIIPNWNGEALLRKNIPHVVASSKGAKEIIVVDDGSTDGSVQFIKTHYPAIHIVQQSRNMGFASTVNAGVRRATGDIVYLMNTDVTPENGYLDCILPHFRAPLVFAVGSLEKSHEGNSVILRGRGIYGWNRGFFIHKRGDVDASTTDWVSGGSGAFRRSVWLSLGGMDTIYNPYYWEDIDLSYRAKKAGYLLVFEPKSVVHHVHAEGAVTKRFSALKVKKIAYRNQFLFIWKNISGWRLMISHCIWLPVKLCQAVFRGDIPMICGFLTALFLLPNVLFKRVRSVL